MLGEADACRSGLPAPVAPDFKSGDGAAGNGKSQHTSAAVVEEVAVRQAEFVPWS